MLATGVVLAGGASRRMGRDKATLVVDGRRLVDRAIEVLAAVCDEVLVASGDGRRLGGLPVRQVADVVADAGPLAGIAAGLEAASTELVAVLAVDHPLVGTDAFRCLLGHWRGEDAVVPLVGSRLQPLVAVWSTAAAATVRAALERGERSPTALLEQLTVATISEDELLASGIDPAVLARDVDAPTDL